MMRRNRIVCVVGPTACHKTECSISLAERVNGEIVSADSVQVYCGMDIGSAKPTTDERQGIPHHMIDCVPIDTPEFSVSQYRSMASKAIDDILSRGKTPIVVGGSGLYVNALTFPLGFAVPRDEQARARMEALYDQDSNAAYARLAMIDPEAASRLHPNDKKRIVRALEVFECSGKPFSRYGNDFRNISGSEAPYEPLLFGLDMDRALLYQRIDLRVDQMIERGLVEEARRIYDAGYSRTLPAMQSIGYRQLFAVFDGETTLEQAAEQIKLDTRHFAKRQLTWFRRDKRIRWQDVGDYEAMKSDYMQESSELAKCWMDEKELFE
ncbi:MAG: tRNA (adenosine(37)-N6)-dimethylallyltransferase MiaA [Clostridiaceae bacterium]